MALFVGKQVPVLVSVSDDVADSPRQYRVTASGRKKSPETLQKLSQSLHLKWQDPGVQSTGVSSYTITNGKTLRIQSIALSVRAGAAAVPWVRLTVRHNTAGATVVGSNVLIQVPEVFGISATSGVGGQMAFDVPDGLEIVGDGTKSIGVSLAAQATTNVVSFTIVGYEY